MPKKVSSSAKKSKASVEKSNRQMRVTIYFGYGLFLLSVIGALVAVAPWFTIYKNVGYLDFGSVTLMIFAFIFSALVPPLAGYLVGDSATRNKSHLLHHYNGVLFGVLGVWLWIVFSFITSYVMWVWPTLIMSQSDTHAFLYTLSQLAPGIVTAAVLIALGILYARSTRHQTPLIDYKPYRVMLIGAVSAMIVAIAISPLFGSDYGSGILTSIVTALIPTLLMVLTLSLIGYWIIGKRGGTPVERIVKSLVALGFGVVAITALSQFLFHVEWQPMTQLYGVVIVAAVWLTYLFVLRRASR